jgi:putative intracellular protease/amidase
VSQVIDTLRGQPALVLGGIAIVLALLCIAMVARVERLKDRLHVAQAAAEDAARAAALAAPGGIDPEVVVELLRSGERPTLDAVYATMQRRAEGLSGRG